MPVEKIYDNDYQKMIRDLLEEGTLSITTIAMDFSTYIEMFLNIVLYLLLASRAGIAYLMISLVCILLSQSMTVFLEKKQEKARMSLSGYRSGKKYYFDIFNEEDNHIEIITGNHVDYITERAKKYDERFATAFSKIQNSVLKYKVINGLFLVAGALTSLFILLFQWDKGILSESTMAILIVGSVLLYTELAKLFSTVTWDAEAIYYAKQYLYFDEERVEGENEETIDEINSIELKNVSLYYKETCAVNDVTLHLKKGDSVLLLGDNGAGKTSLLSILSGMRVPTVGDIYVNDKHYSGMQGLINQTAYVSQNFPQFAISVKESLFTVESQELIEKTLKSVGIWDKIANTEKGIDSIVGRDISFSKGEWQRILVARLLLNQKRDIWILDEPTSAMDALHEEDILKLIHEQAKDKILIIVTHRLGFCSKAGKIIRMEKGRIINQGSFDELMNNDSYLKEAYEAQRRMYRNT